MNIFKTKQKVTVKEIHDTFFTEVDRLLAEANIKVEETSDKEDLLNKAERLRKLGFGNASDVSKAKQEEERIANAKSENETKDRLQRAIEYFSVKYPMYKFITEESVKRICEKYGLIYGEVQHYTGDVPEKNLKQIESFKVSEEDIAYWSVKNWRFGSEKTPISFYHINDYENKIEEERKQEEELLSGLSNSERIHYMSLRSMKQVYSRETFKEMSIEIAAPKDDFDTSKMNIENFKLQPIKVPDPVVLQPVMFEETKYYLIITAWGDEAEDESVVNHVMN